MHNTHGGMWNGGTSGISNQMIIEEIEKDNSISDNWLHNVYKKAEIELREEKERKKELLREGTILWVYDKENKKHKRIKITTEIEEIRDSGLCNSHKKHIK